MALKATSSILASRMNMRCEHGHKLFSPTPELFLDGLHECGVPLPAAPDSTRATHCRGVLLPYRERKWRKKG